MSGCRRLPSLTRLLLNLNLNVYLKGTSVLSRA